MNAKNESTKIQFQFPIHFMIWKCKMKKKKEKEKQIKIDSNDKMTKVCWILNHKNVIISIFQILFSSLI